jgi:hypothetical protein
MSDIGRPLKFATPEALQAKIDEYFEVTPKDEITWTGLAIHLDTSRETLREYKERPEFVDSLKKALLKVEHGYEVDLKKRGQAGTIFALKNFGWTDKQEIDQTNRHSGEIKHTIDHSKLSESALREIATLDKPEASQD